MCDKSVLFAVLITLFFSFAFAGAEQTTTVSPSVVDAGLSTVLLNFSVRNDNLEDSIDILKVSLPPEFIFVEGSESTTASGTSFSNTSSTVRWDGEGFMSPDQTEYFTINVSTPSYVDEFSLDVNATFSGGSSDIEYLGISTQDSTFPENIVLISPSSNNSLNTVPWIFVNISFTEAFPALCILAWKNDTEDANNITMNLVGDSYCFFNVSQEDYVVSYSVYVKDDSNNCGMNGVWYAIADSTPPSSVSSVSPTLGNGAFSDYNWVFANFSFSESNPDSCVLALGNGTNFSMNLFDSYCYLNLTGLSDGSLTYRVWVNDSADNWGSSSLRSVIVETYSPKSIVFVYPTPANSASTGKDYFFVNVSFDEPNVDSCLFDNGDSNVSMSVTGDYCYINRTGLDYGSYSFKVWINDSSGNLAVSALRQVSFTCSESWLCTAWSDCSGGVQTRTCSDSNECGTTSNKPPESQSCGSEEVTTGSSETVVELPNTESWNAISPFEKKTITSDDSGVSVSSVVFEVNRFISNPKITIVNWESKLPVSEAVGGVVYQYVQLFHQGFQEGDFESVNISFSVNKSWVESNIINVSSVVLNRFSSSWQVLPTVLLSNDSDMYYFVAESPGMSYFAVSGEVLADVILSSFCGDGVCDEGESWSDCPSDCLKSVNSIFDVAGSFFADREYLILLVVYVVLVVFMLLVVAFFMFRGGRGEEKGPTVSEVEVSAVEEVRKELKEKKRKKKKSVVRRIVSKPVRFVKQRKKRKLKKKKKHVVRLPPKKFDRKGKRIFRKPRIKK